MELRISSQRRPSPWGKGWVIRACSLPAWD